MWTSLASNDSTAAPYPEPVPISSTRSFGRHACFLAHECDGVWLRDCLFEADGKCPVVVRHFEEFARHEFVPWHPFHGFEHARIVDAALLELLNDHVVTGDSRSSSEGNLMKREVLITAREFRDG